MAQQSLGFYNFNFVGSFFVGNFTIGTPEQTFTLLLDTGTSDVWVADQTWFLV